MAFRSRLEEKVADLLVELGVKYEYETEKISYVIEHKYSPDFILPNGVYLECKGYWDSADRKKIKAVKTQHPDLDLRMVFQAPYNTISKKSENDLRQVLRETRHTLVLVCKYPIELAPMTSEFVRHMACPHCGSSDAASLYDDGHIFCFRCYTHTPGDGTESFTIIKCEMSTYKDQPEGCRSDGSQNEPVSCSKTYKDGDVLRFHYYDSSGSLLGAKIKTKDKEFRCEGEVKTLFGMQNFRHKTSKKKEQKLVICEGEMDACPSGKHSPTGTWSPSRMVHLLQRKRSNITMNGSITTTRSSFSLITMKPARRPRKKPPVCYHLARFHRLSRGLQGRLRRFTG